MAARASWGERTEEGKKGQDEERRLYSPGPPRPSSHHPSLWSKAAWQKEPRLLGEAPGEAVVGP